MVKVNTARSNFKSRSHLDDAHLQPPTNVPTKYQLPTPYSFRDIACTGFYKSKLLWQGQIKSRSHHDVAHLQPPPMSLPNTNFLHLTVSEISPGHDIIDQGHYGKVKGQIRSGCTSTTPN